RAPRFVQALPHQLIDDRLVWLGHFPVQQVMGSDVAPALVPRASIGDQGDPRAGANAEVMAAVAADVVVLAPRLEVKRNTAAWTVGGQRDIRQLAPSDPNFRVCLGQRAHSERPPSTARTWPVMNPARSEHRN